MSKLKSSGTKWAQNGYKWSYRWLTGAITPINGVITLLTPRKINMEPENDGLVQMIFLFQGAHILRFQPLIFQGV